MKQAEGATRGVARSHAVAKGHQALPCVLHRTDPAHPELGTAWRQPAQQILPTPSSHHLIHHHRHPCSRALPTLQRSRYSCSSRWKW